MDRSLQGEARARSDLRGDGGQMVSKITSYATPEDLQRKDRQQAEMKLALQQQMQEKQRRKQEEHQRTIEDDRRQEERIKKQLAELNAEYVREAQSREGFYQPESSTTKPMPEHRYAKQQPETSPPRPQPNKPRRGRAPTPIEQRVEPADPPTRASLPPARLVYVKDLWRDREDLNEKNAQLQEILTQLKEQSAGLRTRDIREEFEGIRREALAKSQAETWSTRDHFKPRTKPFALVARSLVAAYQSPTWTRHSQAESKRDYGEIESLEIRQQLGKLDNLLSLCSAPAAVPAPTHLAIERLDEPKSPELRSSGQSVPLTFSLRSPD